MDYKCARCGEAVEQDGVIEYSDEDFNKGEPVWVADGCYVCEWYTGHDEDGKFSPTHEVSGARVELYDAKYTIHHDAYQCPECKDIADREEQLENIEFIADFFRMRLGYDKPDTQELAKILLRNIQA